MWTLPNVAINPGEPVEEVLNAHRIEFENSLRENIDLTLDERIEALAEFDRIRALILLITEGSKFTFTISMTG